MSLIDREKAIEKLEQEILNYHGHPSNGFITRVVPKLLVNVIQWLKKLPAVEAAPMEYTGNTGRQRIFECEKCGYGFVDIFLSNERDYPIDPVFCPNCGRKVNYEEAAAHDRG